MSKKTKNILLGLSLSLGILASNGYAAEKNNGLFGNLTEIFSSTKDRTLATLEGVKNIPLLYLNNEAADEVGIIVQADNNKYTQALAAQNKTVNAAHNGKKYNLIGFSNKNSGAVEVELKGLFLNNSLSKVTLIKDAPITVNISQKTSVELSLEIEERAQIHCKDSVSGEFVDCEEADRKYFAPGYYVNVKVVSKADTITSEQNKAHEEAKANASYAQPDTFAEFCDASEAPSKKYFEMPEEVRKRMEKVYAYANKKREQRAYEEEAKRQAQEARKEQQAKQDFEAAMNILKAQEKARQEAEDKLREQKIKAQQTKEAQDAAITESMKRAEKAAEAARNKAVEDELNRKAQEACQEEENTKNAYDFLRRQAEQRKAAEEFIRREKEAQKAAEEEFKRAEEDARKAKEDADKKAEAEKEAKKDAEKKAHAENVKKQQEEQRKAEEEAKRKAQEAEQKAKTDQELALEMIRRWA